VVEIDSGDIEKKMENENINWEDLGIKEIPNTSKEEIEKLKPNEVVVYDEAQQFIDKVARLKEMKRIRAQRYYYSKGKAHRKEYYQKNKVRINEQAKKYKQSPGAKEKRQAYMKEYMKAYYEKNKDYFLKYHEKKNGDKKEEGKENENEHNKE
jgi:hypothetical protein